ncbi:Hydroxymethylglutaryl-CoA lyase [hydrothermal vent metagenome]|uniref:Hydroxymethylglutaryl-CoA lyase n=1 Tax=hydrothermal vent metagenome TaxID=652676 RepID=A0A3B0Y9T4_9ZZZZ
MDSLPAKIRIVEVAPRDGLQALKKLLTLEQKIDWVNRLSECGYSAIEIGSLVNHKLVPQMQQTDELFRAIKKSSDCQYLVLIGNLKWLKYAIDLGVKHVSFMCSASNSFSEKNMHQTLDENLRGLTSMLELARQHKLFVRVYLSCSFDCPCEGRMDERIVSSIVERIWQTGCDEISLSDTTGKAQIVQIQNLLENCMKLMPPGHLAVHFHNNQAQALANALVSLQMGVTSIDSAAGGLGGCPFISHAKGNLATEHLLYMLQGMNIDTGIDNEKVLKTSQYILPLLEG